MSPWLWILIAIAWILILMVMLSHSIWHRSFMATFVEIYIKYRKRIGYRSIGITKRKIEENNGLEYEMPPGYRMRMPVSDDMEFTMRTYRVNEKTDSQYLIFYLAGGAFIHGPKTFHWNFIDDLCRMTDAAAVVPIYHRLPERTCVDLFPLLSDMYRSVVESREWKKIVLLGDSAGGNIVFALAEELLRIGYRQPDEIISISPPTGYPYAGHEEEFAKYERTCVFLDIESVNYLADRWAGDAGLEDYRVSPYFGDVKGMGRTTIFAGERELLYPSARGMHRKLLENGVESEFVSGRGMMHDYPVLPMPEMKDIRKRICGIITR